MDVLDQLMIDAAGVPPGGQSTESSQPIQKLNYSHKAMIDLIIANPGISQNQIAATFRYSPSWVSQVMSSDSFQAAFAARSAEIVDPVLKMTANERFEALVRRSQEILLEKLSKPADVVPDQLAVAVLNSAARARGYGAREQAPVVSTADLHVHLHDLGDRLTTLLRRKKTEVIDAEVEAIAGGGAED